MAMVRIGGCAAYQLVLLEVGFGLLFIMPLILARTTSYGRHSGDGGWQNVFVSGVQRDTASSIVSMACTISRFCRARSGSSSKSSCASESWG